MIAPLLIILLLMKENHRKLLTGLVQKQKKDRKVFKLHLDYFRNPYSLLCLANLSNSCTCTADMLTVVFV